MGQLNARLEDLPHSSSLADLSTTKGELTQVSAALQPDGPQVIVQFLQGGRAAHLQVQPEIILLGILYAQVVERLLITRLRAGQVAKCLSMPPLASSRSQ